MTIIYITGATTDCNKFVETMKQQEVVFCADEASAFNWMHDHQPADILITPAIGKIRPKAIANNKRLSPQHRHTMVICYAPDAAPFDIKDVVLYGLPEVIAEHDVPRFVERVIQLLEEGKNTNLFPSFSNRRSRVIKRMIDVCIAATGLVLVSPVILMAAIAIKIESGGAVFYRSKRVGSNYKVFDLLKFRTMIPDADSKLNSMSHLNLYSDSSSSTLLNECAACKEAGHPCSPIIYGDNGEICENLFYARQEQEKQGVFFKVKDDPRVSRVGKLLRNSSIDELPQLINILRGEMSLVGNRPLPLYEAERLTSDHRAFRFLAPAGLTGLWQVTKRGKKEMSEEERIALDNTYALNHSILLDFKIMFKTFPALLQGENV